MYLGLSAPDNLICANYGVLAERCTFGKRSLSQDEITLQASNGLFVGATGPDNAMCANLSSQANARIKVEKAGGNAVRLVDEVSGNYYKTIFPSPFQQSRFFSVEATTRDASDTSTLFYVESAPAPSPTPTPAKILVQSAANGRFLALVVQGLAGFDNQILAYGSGGGVFDVTYFSGMISGGDVAFKASNNLYVGPDTFTIDGNRFNRAMRANRNTPNAVFAIEPTGDGDGSVRLLDKTSGYYYKLVDFVTTLGVTSVTQYAIEAVTNDSKDPLAKFYLQAVLRT